MTAVEAGEIWGPVVTRDRRLLSAIGTGTSVGASSASVRLIMRMGCDVGCNTTKWLAVNVAAVLGTEPDDDRIHTSVAMSLIPRPTTRRLHAVNSSLEEGWWLTVGMLIAALAANMYIVLIFPWLQHGLASVLRWEINTSITNHLCQFKVFRIIQFIMTQYFKRSEESQQRSSVPYKARLKARYKQFPSPKTFSGTWLSSKAGFISRSTAVAIMSLCPGMRPEALWWAGGRVHDWSLLKMEPSAKVNLY